MTEIRPDGNSIRCRDAVEADAETIVAFQLRMARETEEVELDGETCRRGVRSVFADPSLGRYFIAEAGGKVVGSLLITFEWSDWRARTVWWIQSVFVDESMRRRGVYASLYAHVREIVDADDTIAGVRLYVDRRNRPAQLVYERLGMSGEHYLVYEWMK
ncbi:MAG: GNAT family N-acetyltransferase [Thermoanaerobaculia bacterium]